MPLKLPVAIRVGRRRSCKEIGKMRVHKESEERVMRGKGLGVC